MFKLIAGVAILIGLGVFLLLPRQEAAICEREMLGLDASAPLELAAILDEDCMRVYAREVPDRLPAALLDFGYPTLLLETENRQDVLDLFTMGVSAGEYPFFASDPTILNRLSDMRRTTQIENIIDFVAASQVLIPPSYVPNDAGRFLGYLPVRDNTEGQALFTQMCESHDCGQSKTVCPSVLGLSDKLAFVVGDSTLEDTIALCPTGLDWEVDRAWFTTLRRSGIVDTTCSATTQINAALNDGMSMSEPCFGPSRQIGDYSSITSGDIATFIKRKIETGRPEVVNASSLERILRFYPDVAKYIAAQ